MFSRIAPVPFALVVACSLAACTQQTEASPPAEDAALSGLPFVPSNVGLSELDPTGAGDVVIGADDCLESFARP